ncbi:hypothetical protein M5D96_010465, partial [Drosophila gunungcola]
RDFEIRWRDINCSVIDPTTAEVFKCDIVEMPKKQGNFLNTWLLLRRLVQQNNVNYTSTRFALNPDHFPAYMPDMKFNTKLIFQLSRNIGQLDQGQCGCRGDETIVKRNISIKHTKKKSTLTRGKYTPQYIFMRFHD